MPGTNGLHIKSNVLLTLCCLFVIDLQVAKASQQLLSIECPEILSQGALNKTYLLCRDAKTYSQATEDAKSKRLGSSVGYLLNIESANENALISSWLHGVVPAFQFAQTAASDEGGEGFVWLGGDDIQSEGEWVWQRSNVLGYPLNFWSGDQSGLTQAGYTNWREDRSIQTEPNNDRGRQDGLALGLEGRSLGQWHDLNTSNELYYIIEFDAVEGADSGLRVAIEEPFMGLPHSGIGSIRGWAISDAGITGVEVYVDGEFAFDAPYGGPRQDVGTAFPEVEGSSRSGFSAAFNFNALEPGQHIVTVLARDAMGNVKQASANFGVVSFNAEFIRPSTGLDLSGGACSLSSDAISVSDALINGSLYEITLQWRASTQGFELISAE